MSSQPLADAIPKTAALPTAAEPLAMASSSSFEGNSQATAQTTAVSSDSSHAPSKATDIATSKPQSSHIGAAEALTSPDPSDKRVTMKRIGVDLNLIDTTTSSYVQGPSASAGKRSATIIDSDDDSEGSNDDGDHDLETAPATASVDSDPIDVQPVFDILDKQLSEQPQARKSLSLKKPGRDKGFIDEETGWTVDYINTCDIVPDTITWEELCLPTTKNQAHYLIAMPMHVFGFENIQDIDLIPVIVRDLKQLVRNS